MNIIDGTSLYQDYLKTICMSICIFLKILEIQISELLVWNYNNIFITFGVLV